MTPRWLLALLASLPLAAAADDEPTRIAAEREVLSARFAREELECQRRFAVNDCIDDVRRRRREALAPLLAREFELDDAERLRRAAERRATIEARQRNREASGKTAPPLPVPASAPVRSPLARPGR